MKLSGIAERIWLTVMQKIVIPRGARIGRDVWISPFAKLDWLHGRHITICDGATIVDGARILCHDASSFRKIGATRISAVWIGERAYIGADAIILPGVRIGSDAIVAAGAVVTHDVNPGQIVAGIPATVVGEASELERQRLEEMKTVPVFDVKEYGRTRLDPEREADLRKAVERHGAYYLTNERDKA